MEVEQIDEFKFYLLLTNSFVCLSGLGHLLGGDSLLPLEYALGQKGVVAFSSQGDRIALTQVEQMIDGTYTKLGYYDTQADNLTWMNKEQWATSKVSTYTNNTII